MRRGVESYGRGYDNVRFLLAMRVLSPPQKCHYRGGSCLGATSDVP